MNDETAQMYFFFTTLNQLAGHERISPQRCEKFFAGFPLHIPALYGLTPYLIKSSTPNNFLRIVWVWSAICFKIMTRQTCGFFPRILTIISATRYTCVFLSRILAFYSQVYDHFLTNAHIYAHKKAHIYALQASLWYMGLQKVVV